MIFVDTGALIARHVQRDRHHSRALEAWAELRSRRRPCMTSNFVLDEALTLLGRRVSYPFAAQRAASWWGSDVLTIVRSEERDELAAVELFRKFADQGVSFTDCISFALMRRNRVRSAFTFDRHFSAAGFEVWPR